MAINPFFLFLAGFLLALLGKKAFGRWFNPVSFYSIIWGGMLGMHELRGIKYPDMTVETWLLIFSAWGVFMLGALTVMVWKTSANVNCGSEKEIFESSVLATPIIILSSLGALGVAQHWMVLIRHFGSVAKVLVIGNIVYSARVKGDLPGMVPYVADLVLAATSLAGVYFAIKGKINLVVIIPLVLIVVEATAWMGRAKILIAAILLFSSYLLTKLAWKTSSLSRRSKRNLIVSMIVVFVVIAGSTEAIRSIRKANEWFYSESPMLRQLKKVPFVTPSIYVYVSGHVAVLDKFLQEHGEGKGEKTFFGENTFASLYRFLYKFGAGIDVPSYQYFYKVPASLNTGTYLREVYADFGESGALFYAYLLGMVSSLLWVSIEMRPRLWKIILLSHVFVLIGFSFATQATRLGNWWISLFASLIASNLIERKASVDYTNAKTAENQR